MKAKRKVCRHRGCTKKLQPNNAIGYCRQHRIDARLGAQRCKEPGCGKRLFQDNRTGYCRQHYSQAMTPPQLRGEELEARRADDKWEKRHGETKSVACRICGDRRERLGSHGKSNHLLEEHGKTVPEYRQYCKSRGWGNPPITSLKATEAIETWRRDNPAKVKALWARRREKRRQLRKDREYRKHENEQQRSRKQRKLSQSEKEGCIRCEMPGCDEWHRVLAKHLRDIHHISVPQYHALHPNAPTVAPEPHQVMSQRSRRLWAEREAQMQRAGPALPADLSSKSFVYQKMVPIMLRHPAWSNKRWQQEAGMRPGRETMRKLRRYCGFPSERGRPGKNV